MAEADPAAPYNMKLPDGAHVNRAFENTYSNDYLLPRGGRKEAEKVTDENQNGDIAKQQNAFNDGLRYVAAGTVPKKTLPAGDSELTLKDNKATSELDPGANSDKESDYDDLDNVVDDDVMHNRPLPNPQNDAERSYAAHIRQTAFISDLNLKKSHMAAAARRACCLRALIVTLVLIILGLVAYIIYLHVSGVCLKTPTPAPTNSCVPEGCSSACSSPGCTSCCSTAVGSQLVSVTAGGLTQYVPQTADNWLVLMKRENGYVDFVSPNWQKYKDGFGNLHSEFWLGNEMIHQLTTNGSRWRLRIDMKAHSGECRHALYDDFSIESEQQFYKLHIANYSGNAGDSMTAEGQSYYNHDGAMFTTYDADHDNNTTGNCAQLWQGGWWYTNCFYAKLTGMYGDYNGIAWETWLGEEEYLQYADMKITVAD